MNDFDQNLGDAQSPGRRGLLPVSGPNAPPRLPPALRADCSRCAGLCCVVPAFYSVQGFGFDKPAHSACRYLTLENRCAIHVKRAALGFRGCVGFDCYGAGQRVTQELCRGVSWRGSDEAAVRLFSAYTSCLALHRLMGMLVLAEATVPPPLAAQMRVKREQLNELCRSEEAMSGRLDSAALQREVLELVRGFAWGAGSIPQLG